MHACMLMKAVQAAIAWENDAAIACLCLHEWHHYRMPLEACVAATAAQLICMQRLLTCMVSCTACARLADVCGLTYFLW